MGLLDLVFPKRCVACRSLGSYICPNCFATLSFTSQDICIVCNSPSLDSLTHPDCLSRYAIDGVFTGLVYTSTMKKLLYAFKHKPHVTDLQRVLVDLLYESLIQKEQFHKKATDNAILVPIPLHESKLRSRGYNQAHVLAKGLSKKLQLPTVSLLTCVKNTPSKLNTSREERTKNIKDAFRLKQGKEREMIDKTVFLVDDILASGATLSEVARVLKRGGARQVFALVLAHGQ